MNDVDSISDLEKVNQATTLFETIKAFSNSPYYSEARKVGVEKIGKLWWEKKIREEKKDIQ